MSDEKTKIKTFSHEVLDRNVELKNELIKIGDKEGINEEKTTYVMSAILSKVLTNERVPKVEEIIKSVSIINDFEVKNSTVEIILCKLTELGLLDLKEESYTKRLKLMKNICKGV